jgi:hypothetical protein
MDPNCAKFVSHYVPMWGNQVQWLLLNGMGGGNLDFINIYASNNLANWCRMWEHLGPKLVAYYKWVICEYFNMIKNAKDKTFSYGKLILKKRYYLGNPSNYPLM